MAIVSFDVLPALSQRMVELSESSSGYPDYQLSTAKALVDLLINKLPVQLPFEVAVVARLEVDGQSHQTQEIKVLDEALAKQIVALWLG